MTRRQWLAAVALALCAAILESRLIRGYFELPGHIEASGLLYGVSPLDAQQLRSYRKLDRRLAWRVSRPIELAVVAQNLLHGRDREFMDTSAPPSSQVRTATFAEIAWRF